MNNNNISFEQIKELVRTCIIDLYNEPGELFKKNKGRGISERCLVFRFAHNLQNKLLQNQLSDYFVDCDFNSSFERHSDPKTGRRKIKWLSGKAISHNGVSKKRFIDIIVHKRNENPSDDFICFEVKKWNNTSETSREKDFNNLRVLTTQGPEGYQYIYGFFLLLGKKLSDTRWRIYKEGEVILDGFVILGT